MCVCFSMIRGSTPKGMCAFLDFSERERKLLKHKTTDESKMMVHTREREREKDRVVCV